MTRKQKKHPSKTARAAADVPNLRGIRKSKKKKQKNAIELVSQSSDESDKRFREQVLASVGLDDDGEDESYNMCDNDIEEAGFHSRLNSKQHKPGNKKRRHDHKDSRKGEDLASENLDLLEEEGDDDREFESNSNSSTTRCSTLKPMCNKLLWSLLSVAAVIFIFYDDEQLEESEIDQDVVQKQQPYSYMGYEDARIPTDDEMQFGGGALPNQDDDAVVNEMNDMQNSHYHEPTGIVEVDILWEQLDGYAEMSEPLGEHDMPVFWHIRE